MMQLSRRGLISGLVALVAAPAIVRAQNIMPVKVIEEDFADIWIEVGRNTGLIKVFNPLDPSQYVTVERLTFVELQNKKRNQIVKLDFQSLLLREVDVI